MSTAGNTIQIVVQAQTQEALAAVQKFATQSAGALQVLSAGTKEVAAGAAKASEHIAGMAYYFRSGIDAIRFAAAGGGQRAAFYAIDEGVRALLASGMKLGTLVPVLGGLAAAVSAGVFIWHEWNKAQEDAEKHAKNLADAWKDLPGLIQQISDMQNTGLLGPGAAGQYKKYLTDPKSNPLFVTSGGQVTPQPSEMVSGFHGASGADLGAMVNSGQKLQAVANRPATLAETQKWVQDQITAGGEVTKEQLDSLSKLREESQKMEAERLQGVEKENQAVRDKYAAEREEMEKNLTLATAQLSSTSFAPSAEVLRAQFDLAQSQKDEQAELAAKDLPQIQKSYDAYQKLYGDVSKDIDETSAKQYIADQRHLEQMRRVMELKQEIARTDAEGHLKSIEGDPALSSFKKTQQSMPILQELYNLQENDIRQLQIAQEGLNKDSEDYLRLQKQIEELRNGAADIKNQMDKAADSDSFMDQFEKFKDGLVQVNQIGGKLGEVVFGSLNTGMSSIASNMTKVIEGTEKWHKALVNIAQSVMTQLLQGLITLIEKLLVELAIDIAIKAVTGGAFAEGGRPDVGKVALVGERGPELFIPDSAGTVIPAHQTAAILQGRGDAGGPAGVNVEGHRITQHFYSSQPHPRDYLGSAEGEQQFIDLARKNRTKIGIGT